MAKIIALAGSNSSTSINFKLVKHASSLLKEHEVELLNMANYPFPMYSEDDEKENGYSNSLKELKESIANADAMVVGVNEHNGHPSAYFKNVLDWLSRIDRSFLENTKVFLLATSPGKGGAKGAMGVIANTFPRYGADIVSSFSLPSFYDGFSEQEGMINEADKADFNEALDTFATSLKS